MLMSSWSNSPATALCVAGAACFLGCAEAKKVQPAAPSREASQEVTFIGTFVSIDYLPEYKGEVLATHFNPMFVLVVDVEDPPPDARIKRGANAIAVHSPAQVFAACKLPDSNDILLPELKGKKFAFTLQRQGKDLVWPQAREIK
jgi:hypothetical protein